MSALPHDASLFGSAANDADSAETREWLDALAAVIANSGDERAHFLLEQLLEEARQHGIDMPFSATTGYVNTIEPENEERNPGNVEIEERLRSAMRWNAMAMVVKANRLNPADGGDLGGHISSFASLASMFGAGFNHFWHAAARRSTVAICSTSRATPPRYLCPGLLGRPIDRRAVAQLPPRGGRQGLSSYPHPKLMPEFWQFPTVSMGLGPADGHLPGALPEVPACPRHC
jgi:pyruvate dehydrogenase E1 component